MIAWYRISGSLDGGGTHHAVTVDQPTLVVEGRRALDGKPWSEVETECTAHGLTVERLESPRVAILTGRSAAVGPPPRRSYSWPTTKAAAADESAAVDPPIWLSCDVFDIPAGNHGGRYHVKPTEGILKSPADIHAVEHDGWFVFPQPEKWLVMCAPGLRRKSDGAIRDLGNTEWVKPGEEDARKPLNEVVASELRRLQSELTAAKATIEARTRANAELRSVIDEMKKGLPRCADPSNPRCERLATGEFPWGLCCDEHTRTDGEKCDLPHAAVVRRFSW